MLKHNINGDTLTVMYSGDIDHHRSIGIRKETDELIFAHMPKNLVLDFSAVQFCDSSGIALVLGRYKIIKELGGQIEIINTSPQITKIFTLANLGRIIKIKAGA